MFCSKRDQIEIDRARFIENLLRFSAKFTFDGLKLPEQRLGCFVAVWRECDDSVDKHWRARRTMQWFSFV